MVEALTLNATAWEKERGVEFGYDGVSTLHKFVLQTLVSYDYPSCTDLDNFHFFI